MLTTDTTTTAALALVPHQLQWCADLIAILGDDRKLVCKRAASGDPWAGTTFIDCDLVGLMSHSLGEIRNLGTTANARVALAANLTAGEACARFTSTDGSRWIQGLVGLQVGTNGEGEPLDYAGRVLDFVLTKSPAAGDGIALLPTIFIRAPQNLPLTPYAAPLIADSLAIPDTVVIEDWSSGSPVEAGRVTFDVHAVEVHEHPLQAEVNGEISVYQSTQSITFGAAGDELEFGFTMKVAGGHANSTDPGTPLVQIAGFAKPAPTQGWDLYPGGSQQHGVVAGGYELKEHMTYPPAFKVRYLRGSTELGVKQMGDGSAINSQGFMQDDFYDPATGAPASPPASGPAWSQGNLPLKKHWNCAMSLVWENGVPAVSPNLRKIYNGAKSSFRHTSGKEHFSVAGSNRMLDTMPASYADNVHSLQNIYTMPPYPAPMAFRARPTAQDPYAVDPNNTAAGGYKSYFDGYMEEPASTTGHHDQTGPGGTRHPRAVVPTQHAWFIKDPAGARLEGNVPWNLIDNEFSKAYAGMSIHFCTDVKTAAGIPKAESFAGMWRLNGGAYYGSPANPFGAQRAIFLAGVSAGNGKWGSQGSDAAAVLAARYDKTGRHPWGWMNYDGFHHGYNAPGMAGMIRIAPIYSLLQRFAYDAHWMGSLGNAPPGAVGVDMWMVRTTAWRMHTGLLMWLNCTNHDNTHNQADCEDRIQADLEKFYDIIIVPAYVEQQQTVAFKGLRNLGAIAYKNPNQNSLEAQGADLSYYLAETLVMCKP